MTPLAPSLGLFGGSFDPIHHGHLLVARAASEELRLDRLFFIPACQSPFKPDRPPTPPRIRLRLLRLALAGEPGWEIDEQELEREGLSYTVETARGYRKRFPGARLFYLVGMDQLAGLPRWREAAELASLVEFAVVPRPPGPAQKFPEPIVPPAPFRFHFLQGIQFGISASLVRARVRAGLPLTSLVPPPVEEAIRKYQLYL